MLNKKCWKVTLLSFVTCIHEIFLIFCYNSLKTRKLGKIILTKFWQIFCFEVFGAKWPQNELGMWFIKFYGELKHMLFFFYHKVIVTEGLSALSSVFLFCFFVVVVVVVVFFFWEKACFGFFLDGVYFK